MVPVLSLWLPILRHRLPRPRAAQLVRRRVRGEHRLPLREVGNSIAAQHVSHQHLPACRFDCSS